MRIGVPGKVIERYGEKTMPMSKVDFGGDVKEVCLSYTPNVEVGQYVLVHVGFAMEIIDEEEAKKLLSCFPDVEAH